MLRRFLVLFALMFWQGGFLFYSAVVVPTAMSVLNPPALQSFVTLRVTRILHLAGAITLIFLAFDMTASRDPVLRWRRYRFLCWFGVAASLAVLLWVHPRMVALMDSTRQEILDREALYPLHRIYLVTSTVQWIFATMFIVLTLRGWQEEDRGER